MPTLGFGYYRAGQVGLSGAQLGWSLRLGRVGLAIETQYLALDEVISPELAAASPDLADLGVSQGFLTVAVAWQARRALALGLAAGRSWRDVLGVQSWGEHAGAGLLLEPIARTRIGVALGFGAHDAGQADKGLGTTLSASHSRAIAGVDVSVFAGGDYVSKAAKVERWTLGLYARPPGPLFALGSLQYERQPFQTGAPLSRTLVLGLGLSVRSIRLELARRWREEGLDDELFVTLSVYGRTPPGR